ncbi:S8 family serine peptidase [Candidatus Neomarinimicrobiota bacterium]
MFKKVILVLSVFSLIALVSSCEEAPQTITGSGDGPSAQMEEQEYEMAMGKKSKGKVGINIVCNKEVTDKMRSKLTNFGRIVEEFPKLNALRIRAKLRNLSKIQALPFVKAAGPDAERRGGPIDTVPETDFTGGWSSWNLDVINVTAGPGPVTRSVAYDGSGVYIGILDTGLKDSWRRYFPQERIAEEYAIAFGGGGMDRGHVSSQPNKWEHDQDSHGTHVTSTILGYYIPGGNQTGVAPMATIIPVKVLNQSGWGWSSVIARGIMYMAELKEGPLAGSPVVINMSLGGPVGDPIELAAIEHAISVGVIVVASAGNEGTLGMGYPGAWEEVISVASSGWIGEWAVPGWWWGLDDPEPSNPLNYYISDFSSRELTGQFLDVAAPGSWIVGPYQLNSGQSLSWYYLGGTSMAAPHVAGTVALMAEKYPALTALEAEGILESSALYLAPGSRTVDGETFTWGVDATGAGVLDAAAALAATP